MLKKLIVGLKFVSQVFFTRHTYRSYHTFCSQFAGSFAIDSEENEKNMSVKIIIDLIMIWKEKLMIHILSMSEYFSSFLLYKYKNGYIFYVYFDEELFMKILVF
jgi:hypothetical protein